MLELRQNKNGLASMKNVLVLKWPHFFAQLNDKEKSAAVSKLPYISQKRVRSYIILALIVRKYHERLRDRYTF